MWRQLQALPNLGLFANEPIPGHLSATSAVTTATENHPPFCAHKLDDISARGCLAMARGRILPVLKVSSRDAFTQTPRMS
jgi:hypothetical protein